MLDGWTTDPDVDLSRFIVSESIDGTNVVVLALLRGPESRDFCFRSTVPYGTDVTGELKGVSEAFGPVEADEAFNLILEAVPEASKPEARRSRSMLFLWDLRFALDVDGTPATEYDDQDVKLTTEGKGRLKEVVKHLVAEQKASSL